MENIILSQDTYDRLINRLNANHYGHKSQSPFDDIRKRIERDAHIQKSGVVVRYKMVRIAYDSIQANVGLVGKKYQSGGDKLLLLDLEEAFDEHDKRQKEPPADVGEEEFDENGFIRVTPYNFPEI